MYQRNIIHGLRRLAASTRTSQTKTYSVLNAFRKNLSTIAVGIPNTVPKVVTGASSKVVGTWLLGMCGGVAGAVVLGGVTRLTESGLSMTDWHLIRGMKPPRSEEEWIEEFTRYKDYPEYKYARMGMTLSEFKWIFYMEYWHRMYGRGLGLAFFIPAIYLWSRGYVSKATKPKVALFGTLIVCQGLLGWYMVKSGLEEATMSNTEHPHVSQYRLAAHLGMAFLLYSGMLWTGLGHVMKENQITYSKEAARLKKFARGSVGLVFLTALSGAFVAGLDGGLVYNSFPKFADRWIPDDIAYLNPWWKNIFENPTTTQFNHRILGMTTASSILAVWLMARPANLPLRARMAANCMLGMASLQVTLGISTLLLYVPTVLAASHQFGSLTLLSLAIWFNHELRSIKAPK